MPAESLEQPSLQEVEQALKIIRAEEKSIKKGQLLTSCTTLILAGSLVPAIWKLVKVEQKIWENLRLFQKIHAR